MYGEPEGGLPPPPKIEGAPSSSYQRNPAPAGEALKNADYKCEINPTHETFVSSAKDLPYVEAHHLVPIGRQGSYGVSLDVISNIVALCPLCHKLLHHGKMESKIDFLRQLLSKRNGLLTKKEILLDEAKLLSYYNKDLLEEEA